MIELSIEIIIGTTGRNSFEILEDERCPYIVVVTEEIGGKRFELRFYLDDAKMKPAPEGFQAKWLYSQTVFRRDLHPVEISSDDEEQDLQ